MRHLFDGRCELLLLSLLLADLALVSLILGRTGLLKIFWRGPFLHDEQSLVGTHLILLEGRTANANILVAFFGLLLS